MSDWRHLRLDWVAAEERNTAVPAVLGQEVFHYSIPVLDETGEGRLEDAAEIGSGKLVLSGGEVLISKLNPRKSRVLIAQRHAYPTVASTEFIALRLSPFLNDRFLKYLLRSDTTRQHLDGAVQSVTRSQQRVDPALLTKMWVSLPPPRQQREIADFLDAETARIDCLIEKRQRMVELLDERRSLLVEQSIRRAAERCGMSPLKRAARRVEVGIVVTPASWYADAGVIALRGVNVRPGEIVLDDLVRISDEGHRFHGKSALHAEDVVVVRTGKAGAAAVVPQELDGVNCIDLVIVRPGPDLVPKFLEFVLNSDWSQKHIVEYSVGTIQSHFNVGAMKALPIPLPSLDEQKRMLEQMTRLTRKLDRLALKVRRQIELLKERRQALITAAVTGELDVTKGAA